VARGFGVVADSYTVIDNRSGKTVEIPIVDGGISVRPLRDLDPNLFLYDPAFVQTAACRSSITYLDGDNGVLRYRGYPIQDLAEQSSYLEVAYLIVHGELPSRAEFEKWTHDITFHTYVHENVRKRFMDGFHHDAHPMGILVATVGALSTFYPEAKNIADPEVRMRQVVRLIAKMPTLAAFAHRFSVGLPFVFPDNSLDFPSNFLSMMW
jgi:citrate synthase